MEGDNKPNKEKKQKPVKLPKERNAVKNDDSANQEGNLEDFEELTGGNFNKLLGCGG